MKRECLSGRASSSLQGSFTVEAAVIFPLIVLALAGLVFALLLLYHKVLLTKSVCGAAAAAAWREADYNGGWPGGEVLTDVVEENESFELESRAILDRLRTQKTSSAKRSFDYIKLDVYQELSREILHPQKTTLEASFHNGLLQKDITITVIQEIRIPFGSALSLQAAATASVTDPAEYIRNIDLAWEYAQRIKKGISGSFPDYPGGR